MRPYQIAILATFAAWLWVAYYCWLSIPDLLARCMSMLPHSELFVFAAFFAVGSFPCLLLYGALFFLNNFLADLHFRSMDDK